MYDAYHVQYSTYSHIVLFVPCLPYVYHMFTMCVPCVYHVCTMCVPYVYHMCTMCVQYVQCAAISFQLDLLIIYATSNIVS